MTICCKIVGLIIFVVFISCESKPSKDFTLKGSITGLRKGMVYLQKENDSGIVNLDSVLVNGQDEFQLHADISEPILLYLNLDKKDGKDYFIPFFADTGIVDIKTSLKQFNTDANISGSKPQALLEEYLKMMAIYKDQNLDLIKAKFNAQKQNDTSSIDSLQKRSQLLLRRKYAYTIQFALNHSHSEVAPYLALYEINDANLKFLDSIYNGLTEKIKSSYYGEQLKWVIDKKEVQIKQQ